jgi:hypothetical protein
VVVRLLPSFGSTFSSNKNPNDPRSALYPRHE